MISSQGGVGINKRHLGSNFFFQQWEADLPTYVIRHKSIYGNNYIIAVEIFLLVLNGMTNKPHKPNSRALVRVGCILVSDTSGASVCLWDLMIQKCCYRTATDHQCNQCHLFLGKIMNKKGYLSALCWSIKLLYVLWTGMDLPNPFFGKVLFFFLGLTAGPTYRPLVWHSNPDTPLLSRFTCEVA